MINDDVEKISALNRVAIAYRCNWSRRRFWFSYLGRWKAAYLIWWAFLATLAGSIIAILEVIFYPLWHLFLSPLKAAFCFNKNEEFVRLKDSLNSND